MVVELVSFVQIPSQAGEEWAAVSALAQRLLAELNSSETLARIDAANEPGKSSAEVQAAFEPAARALGFASERAGLFADSIAGLRPDYYLPLGVTGVILEVERGKTTINNMDLLDFWKCHICEVASFLFLLVPRALRQNDSMRPRNEFETVRRRLSQFFEESNYTNVRGLCLFGY